MREIFVEKKISEKSKKEYYVCYIDFGYRVVNISYEVPFMVELTGLTYEQVCSFEINKPYLVGSITQLKREVK